MLSDEVTSDSFPQKPGSGGIPARLRRDYYVEPSDLLTVVLFCDVTGWRLRRARRQSRPQAVFDRPQT